MVAFFDDAAVALGVAPLDWRKNLQQGMFKNVPFHISSHEYSSGRRHVDHEFPSKEQGNSEDLGKSLPRFSMSLYVLGDDYFVQRDALIEALNSEGAGELIHPYLGRHEVQAGPFTMSESVQDGRIARFSVQFITAGTARFPASALDGFSAVNSTALKALEVVGDGFSASIDLLTAPARITEEAADFVRGAADLLTGINRKLGTVTAAASDTELALQDIRSNVFSLLNSPRELSRRFNNAFASLLVSASDQKELSRALFFEGLDEDQGPPGSLRYRSQRALRNLIIEQSLSYQAMSAIRGEYLSTQEALNVRDFLNRNIDAQLNRVDDDVVFQSIKDLQVEVNRAFPPPSVGQVLTYTPAQSLPAIVIAYQLFGGIEKEEIIIQQNKIRHPGFVPGGQEIEIPIG